MEEAVGSYEPYEVFVRSSRLEPHQHVGSVLAPSSEVALQIARHNFLRRDKAVSLWVVPKRYVAVREDEAFFADELDKSYRRVDGYADNAKRWKAFKQKQLHIEDIVSDMEEGAKKQ